MHIAMTKLPDTPTAPLAAGPTAADDLCCRPFYRKRCTNFTDDDRRLLLRLIRPHLTVIENKNAERTTSIRKKDTWTSIAVQYNARMRQTAGTVRTPSQLKLCYEAMKYKLRKSLKDGNPTGARSTMSVVDEAEAYLNKMRNSRTESIDTKWDIKQEVKPANRQTIDQVDAVRVSIKEEPNATRESKPSAVKTFKVDQSTQTAHSESMSAAALINLQTRNHLERQAMKREKHQLKMAILRLQLKKIR